jgi:hypothetical protein
VKIIKLYTVGNLPFWFFLFTHSSNQTKQQHENPKVEERKKRKRISIAVAVRRTMAHPTAGTTTTGRRRAVRAEAPPN